MAAITIPREILDQIEAQAREEQPRECCGVLGGRGHRVHSHYPLRNQARRPEARFFASPEDLFAAIRRMRAAGETLLAIYHSHPRGPARPSPTDIELAFYPGALHLIISLAPRPMARAFEIRGQRVTEVEITVAER